MAMKLEPVSASALRAFKKLPEAEQQDFAKALQDVMEGRKPRMEFKPLNNIGRNIRGVVELIINGSPAYRTVYVAKYNNTVYLLQNDQWC